MLDSFSKVLEILANKVSRKATVIVLAMILVYFIAVTPTVTSIVFTIGVISSLAVFFTILQWIIDIKKNKKENG